MKTARPDIAVSLYMHNDARYMRGGKSSAERVWLIENLEAILFVSEYLKQAFIQDLPADRLAAKIGAKCHVIGNEITRTATRRPVKKKTLILAGRMVEEKGILEACLAAAQILPNFPDWHLHVVGGGIFKNQPCQGMSTLFNKPLCLFASNQPSTGLCKAQDLAVLQSEASIALVPSLWDDPAPLAVLEALAHGCALLTTDKGGIPETATGRAEIAAIGQFDRNVHLGTRKKLSRYLLKS